MHSLSLSIFLSLSLSLSLSFSLPFSLSLFLSPSLVVRIVNYNYEEKDFLLHHFATHALWS